MSDALGRLIARGKELYQELLGCRDDDQFGVIPLGKIRYDAWIEDVESFFRSKRLEKILPMELFGHSESLWPAYTIPKYQSLNWGSETQNADERRLLDRAISVLGRQIDFLNSDPLKQRGDEFYRFTLSSDGRLSRPFDGAEYAIEKGSRRHKLIKELSRGVRRGYRDTKDLADMFDTTTGAIYRDVGNIRRQIKKAIPGIEGEEFIEGKKDSGYRLGQKISISLKN